MPFLGFARDMGNAGVRNHVVIVSTVFCSSTVTRKIGQATGAITVIPDGGCLELGPALEHTERVLRGVVMHPNVGAVLVIGLGCEQLSAEDLASAAQGKPSEYLNIQTIGGTSAAIERGIRLARKMIDHLAQIERRPCSEDNLVLATQCGGSDTGSGLAANPVVGYVADRLIEAGGAVLLGEPGNLYGAIGSIIPRALTPKIGRQIIAMTDYIEAYYKRLGREFRQANPTPGNIAGGLTTLVEKSLGGFCKGGTSPIQGVLKAGEQMRGKGLWIMDTSLGVDTFATTDMVAGGAQLVAFTTGRGNPVGSALAPVIKITAAQETVSTMGENIDFDASSILRAEETIMEGGERLFRLMLEIACGRLTTAEMLGHFEFSIGNLDPH